MQGYSANLEELTTGNQNFRQVLYTGSHLQLVVMSLLPGEEIGEETHPDVDQFFRIEVGQLEIVMNGEKTRLGPGMVAIVPAGTHHNLVNVGQERAKLYTIYAPANHPNGTIHATKAESDRAEY